LRSGNATVKETDSDAAGVPATEAGVAHPGTVPATVTRLAGAADAAPAVSGTTRAVTPMVIRALRSGGRMELLSCVEGRHRQGSVHRSHGASAGAVLPWFQGLANIKCVGRRGVKSF
jgi:hypothetical protein